MDLLHPRNVPKASGQDTPDFAIIDSMPSLTFIVHRLSSNAKVLRLNLFLRATCCVLLITLLSGCSAVGFKKYAALQVTSTPEASIFLDDKHLGKTPFYSNKLDSGTHSLKISASDASYSEKIDLKDQVLTVVNRQLANNPLAQSGELLTLAPDLEGLMVTSLPNEAQVTLDGKYLGKTPLQITNVSAGEHKVLISKEGFIDREFVIKITKDKQVQAQVTLASQITKVLSQAQDTTPAQSAKVTITRTTRGVLNVLKSPDASSAQIGDAKIGEQYDLIGQQDNWLMINFQGKQGWIPTDSAKRL